MIIISIIIIIVIIIMNCLVQVKNAFQKIDVNGDGKLSKREMLAGDEFTQEEVFIIEFGIFVLLIHLESTNPYMI